MAQELNEVLIRLDVDAGDAQRELDKMAAATAQLERKFGMSAKKIAGDFNPIERAVQRASKASGQYAQVVERLTNELNEGSISLKQYESQIVVAQQALNRAGGGVTSYAVAATRGLNSTRAMGTAIQQTGYQVGDFAVQVASGQSAMRAFIQQGTQLVSMFGPYGAIAGAILAIGGAIYTAFDRSEEAVDEATEAVSDFSSVISESDGIVAAYKDKIVGVADEYKRLTEEINRANESQIGGMMERLKEELLVQATALSETLKKAPALDDFGIAPALLEDFKRARGLAESLPIPENARVFFEAYDRIVKVHPELVTSLSEVAMKVNEVRVSFEKLEAAEAALKKVRDALQNGSVVESIKGSEEEFKEAVEFQEALQDAINDAIDQGAKWRTDNREREEREHQDSMERQRKLLEQQLKDRAGIYKMLEKAEDERQRLADRRAQEALRRRKREAMELAREKRKHDEEMRRNFEQVVGHMGDALAEFVTTGKINFKSLADSMINDMIRIVLQQQVTKPLAGAIGDIFGSIFSGVSASSIDASSPGGQGASGGLQAAGGGYVVGPGTSTSDSIPARLSNGEFVINAEATRRHKALLMAINDGRTVKAFSAGGLVGPVPAAANSGGGFDFIFNDNRSGSAPQAEITEGVGSDGRRQLILTVRDTVRRQIDNGEFDSSFANRYGAKPVTRRRG